MQKIEFYLDPFEFLNKPRRIFMGLELLVDIDREHSEEEHELVLKIIEEAKNDFYNVTLPKFEEKINKIWQLKNDK